MLIILSVATAVAVCVALASAVVFGLVLAITDIISG